jgi:hypothetical protein
MPEQRRRQRRLQTCLQLVTERRGELEVSQQSFAAFKVPVWLNALGCVATEVAMMTATSEGYE